MALLRAGLWEQEARLSQFRKIDFNSILHLAEEQTVVGLITAGLEHVDDEKVPKEVVFDFIGRSLSIEQRNKAMNSFIANYFDEIRGLQLNPVLLKGQGVAQYYARPLWRSSGDVDLLFAKEEFERAVDLIRTLHKDDIRENSETKECCFNQGSWAVEFHGSLNCLINHKMDSVLGDIQQETCVANDYRKWRLSDKEIYLPSIDNEVIIIFTHIVKHLFRGGIGIRQICDLCRLLYVNKDDIDRNLLYRRLSEMGMMTEWKVFASLAVDTLGIENNAIPFYESSKKWRKKSERILDFIFETGNFGHNRDVGYQQNNLLLVRKAISLWRLSKDSLRLLWIFPKDAITSWILMVRNKI